ncbi:MAG: hypothetical protein Q9187_002247 [Circinaria calcarea]
MPVDDGSAVVKLPARTTCKRSRRSSGHQESLLRTPPPLNQIVLSAPTIPNEEGRSGSLTMPSSFWTEVESYYESKKSYTKLLQQALPKDKPRNESRPKRDPTKMKQHSQEIPKNPFDELDLDGSTPDHQATVKAMADMKLEMEQEKAKPKGKR